jgi:hypothetical protein
MKTIARILETTGFCATFVAFAYSLAYTIDPGTCKRIVIGPIGWSVSFVMMALVLGFGAVSRNKLSKRMQLGFCLFSALFLGAQAKFLYFYDYGTSERKWQGIVAVFTPELRLGDALEALAAFYVDIVHYWMPFASAVSLLAFVCTLFSKNSKKAEQVVAHRPA